MTRIDHPLHGDGWTVQLLRGGDDTPADFDLAPRPAAVPGSVFVNLIDSGAVPDPYLADNEKRTRWIGRSDWRYATTFDVPSEVLQRRVIELVFARLDTAATVRLNGEEIGYAENHHHPHAFDVAGKLRPTDNVLEIDFRSPVEVAYEHAERIGRLPHAGNGSNPALPHHFIRRMSCGMGWDWGPILPTCGVEGPVTLRAFDVARIDYVRPLVTKIDENSGQLDIFVDLASNEAITVRAILHDPAGREVARQDVVAEGEAAQVGLLVDAPQWWWPRGQGGQPLYALTVELLDGRGRETLDQWNGRVGFRTVRLDQSEDDAGSRFAWTINNREIFMKGANWIPDDCFPTRATPDRVRRRIEQAVEANVNMLRIWGGGLYADHDLLDMCDELGILVAQDFLFACAAYPEEEPFRGRVEVEARHNIRELSRHPALIHWNGCNENLWGQQDWVFEGKGWPEWTADRTWGAGYYFELLPRLILELDPTRTYTPGSPFSKDRDHHPQQPSRGTVHLWPADYSPDSYRDTDARFVNEFGQQGPPTYATLKRALPDDALRLGNPLLDHHQRAQGGTQDRISAHLPKMFGVDVAEIDFDTWHYLAQLYQCRAVGRGVEYWRSRRPHCMGAVYWQWNDCWPVISWAAVDGDGRKKLLWHATKHFFANRLLTFQPIDDGRLRLAACNDTPDLWRVQTVVRRVSFDGTELARDELDLDVPPNTRVDLPTRIDSLNAGELLVADTPDAARATWFANHHAPKPIFDATADGTVVTVTAQTLLRDVCLFPDRLDPAAEASGQLQTLLPGESATFTLNKPVDAAAITKRPVLRSIGDWTI